MENSRDTKKYTNKVVKETLENITISPYNHHGIHEKKYQWNDTETLQYNQKENWTVLNFPPLWEQDPQPTNWPLGDGSRHFKVPAKK